MLSRGAVAGSAVLAAIGFTGSYTALEHLGLHHGFGWFSYAFPVGVDAGIGVLLALDLHLIRRRTPWPVLRLLAHLLTAATIAFNASSAAKGDVVGAAMHGVLPLLFVASVEAWRRLVVKAADLEAGRESAGVPLHRWLLAPAPSWRMYRRMRLYGISSYPQAVAMEKERTVYRTMLERKHGDWRKAPSEARLPLTMARYGLSVDEALALPAEAEEAERRRDEAEEDRRLEARKRADQRAADAEVSKLTSQATVEAARYAVEAQTGVAAVESRSARQAAEAAAEARNRGAVAEAQAFESEAAAEANKRAAEMEEAAAGTRARAAETDRAAAETELRAAETRRRAAEANQAAEVAEAEQAAAVAEAKQRAVEAERAAAETQAAVLETQARVAEAELRALEAEDTAKLTPTERAARKVARMILATGGTDPEAVKLQAIADALGVSTSIASKRRQEAAELLASGYRPTDLTRV